VLRESIFDGVEVRAVGREIEQLCACYFDEFTDSGSLMAREVINDDDVAGAEFPNEDLLDIGLEGIAVDRTVEHEGRDEAA
jgi:hypothetical protein